MNKGGRCHVKGGPSNRGMCGGTQTECKLCEPTAIMLSNDPTQHELKCQHDREHSNAVTIKEKQVWTTMLTWSANLMKLRACAPRVLRSSFNISKMVAIPIKIIAAAVISKHIDYPHFLRGYTHGMQGKHEVAPSATVFG